MKPFLLCAISLWVNLHAQTQSQDWIDLSNRSDAEMISMLEKAVAALAESPAEEASNRVYILQMQENTARQNFDQKTILLEGELTAAAAAKEAAEKAFSDLRTDSAALSAKLDLYARSQQRPRERLDKFPFKAVILAKAIYTGNLERVKEKMIFEAGRLAIKEVNGMQIISETLVKNNILVSDIIEVITEGRADCQPREWKTLVKGTAERVICLYGIYDIYPLVEPIKLSAQAAQLQLPIATYFIRSPNDASFLSLPPSIQEEIRAMLIAAERANVEVRNNMNMLVQQEMQVLRSSGVADSKGLLKSKSDALKRQMDSKRLDLFAKRQAYVSVRTKFWDHINSEQRIEIVTQSDLERNRSQDVIKTKLMRECLTQSRTMVKSLFSPENSKVVNFQLVENSSKSMFRQVQLQAAKVLGIYLSPSEGDIKYTAAVAFRFGFEYNSPTKVTNNVATNVTKIDLSFLPDQPTTNATTNIIRPNSCICLRLSALESLRAFHAFTK